MKKKNTIQLNTIDLGGGTTKGCNCEAPNLGAYANYDKCIPCVYMSFHGCTHPYRDEIGDVNGCVYFADAQKERDNDWYRKSRVF